VAALAPACGGGALQPDGVTSGRGGTGGGSAAGAGTGGIGGTAGAAGSTGPSSCPQITVAPGVLNPCGRTYSIAFSPDGRLLATGTEGARPNVHLWRLSDGGHVRDTDGAGMTTYHVEFSPDGTLLATAGGYTETGGALDTLPEIVKLFNVADGSLVRTIPARCGSYASTAAFSHDGALLATAGEQGPVEVSRVAAGTLVASIGYPTTVDNVRFSPDDTKVLVGGVDRRTTVWSLPDGALMMTLDGTGDEMADASYSPDGREIISTGANNALALWDVTTGAVRQTLPGHTAYVSHVIWSGPNRLLSNDWSGTVKSWSRVGAGDFILSGGWTTGGQSLGMALSSDGKLLVAGGADGAAGVEGFVFLPL
jgi:WD40 repeat protein